MKKSYRKTKQEDLLPLKGVLESVFKDLNLDEKIFDYTIMQAWNEFMKRSKGTLGTHTFAHRITKDRALVIGVKSAVVANELHFVKPKLEQDFLDYLYEHHDLKSKPRSRQITKLIFELRS
jgi:hypothetical protein